MTADSASAVPAGDALVLPAGATLTDPWKRLGSWLLEGILATVTLGIGWLIWAAMIASNGQTPAKKLLGIRVITANRIEPASFAKMFWVRGILAGLVASIAFSFTLGVLIFMPFWDKRNQTIYEKVSGTYVVDDPSNAWNR